MRAISLWDPWASAMAAGLKKNETRKRAITRFGDVVICAAKREMDLLTADWFKKQPWRVHLPDPLPYGHAVCVVEFYEWIPSESFYIPESNHAKNLTDLERSLGDYSMKRYIWLSRNLRVLKKPVPVKGRQWFFDLTPTEEAAVKAQLP